MHDDTCFVVLELWQREYLFEEFHSQVGILVFFHVEVDEFGPFLSLGSGVWVVDGCLIEFRHAANQFWKALFVVECMGLGIDARDFDRDVVDVGLFQCL